MPKQQGAKAIRGGPAAALELAILAAGVAGIAVGASDHKTALSAVGGVLVAAGVLLYPGFIVVQPNESRVLILLGRYVGTVIDAGLWWVNPLTAPWRETVSLRVRNF